MNKLERLLVRLAKWVVFGFFGLVFAILMLAGVRTPWPATETTHQKPYADFVGREYRVVSEVSAYAWNDYPDKAKIQSISLISPPGIDNRFVSYVIPLKTGQRIRIVSAWRQLVLFGFHRHYVVLVPGAGLPEGIDITFNINSDGVPDPLVYEPIDR